MPDIRSEWDEKKHSVNKRKHGISFTEGQTAFADENGLLIDDPDHSDDEERFIPVWAPNFDFWLFLIPTAKPI